MTSYVVVKFIPISRDESPTDMDMIYEYIVSWSHCKENKIIIVIYCSTAKATLMIPFLCFGFYCVTQVSKKDIRNTLQGNVVFTLYMVHFSISVVPGFSPLILFLL